MFPGTTITIGDEQFIVPALSLGQLRNGALTKLKEHDLLLVEEKTFEAMVVRGEIILEALRRNYPDFDDKKLFDYLDLSNTGSLWMAILGASGFTPGEARAVRAITNGTSGPSIEASPPPTDGPIVK